MNYSLVGCVLCCLTALTAQGRAQENDVKKPAMKPFPPPKNLGDATQLGRNVQRTMALLAGSTPQQPNTVRILFYGQSITEGSWWQEVADDLRRRFPDADLQIENRALGGFSSQRLVKTAESDLYRFAPDLMIFHVYGAHDDYENIIRRARSRTTTEVLIQTDHVTKDTDLDEETDPAKIRLEGAMWDSFMNSVHLPTVARRYDCALLDQRNLWTQYLRDYDVRAPQLLRDGVHPNEWGNYLMAELTKAYLVRRDDVPIDPMNCDMVRTLVVGRDVQWKNGQITLPFEGNRIDAIARDTKDADEQMPAAIEIDGVKPSAHAELYGFTRALATPGGKWPVILKIGSQKPLVLEEWTLKVNKVPNEAHYNFALSGSQTGADGSGRSDQRFVSDSGRVVIEAEDWDVEYALSLPGIKPVPDEFEVRWKVVADFADAFVAPTTRANGIENVVTLAQGLKPRTHILRIDGSPATPIAALRVYRPPFDDN